MRRAPEQQLQIAAAGYLDLVLPDEVIWTAVNAQPFKSKAAAGLAKAMGQKSGWPDMQLIYESRIFLIELKSMTGTFTDSQRLMFPRLRKHGVPLATCRSLAEVDLALDSFGIPHRRVDFQEARRAAE